MDDWVDVEKPERDALPLRSVKPEDTDPASSRLYAAINKGVLRRLGSEKLPVFHVDLGEEPCYTTFLNNISPELRQNYACSICRRFADRYGDLALVSEDGTLKPLLWSPSEFLDDIEATKMFAPAIQALQKRFEGKKVVKEFKIVEKCKELGTEEQGGFHHMHVEFPEFRVRKEELAGFTSANSEELAAMLEHVLADYKLGTVRKANSILGEDKLRYADNHKASAKWLLELLEEDKIGRAKSPEARHNLLYHYAASSFIGSLKQMRSGVLGMLLNYVKANMPFKLIETQWYKMCDPTQYMRPQAAPTTGNIRSAERLFEQLGLTKDDLKRRLAVQDDVPEEVIMWSSERMKEVQANKDKPEKPAGIFSNLKAKEKAPKAEVSDDTPATTISFTRFVTAILPAAKKIDCWLGATDPITTFISGLEGSKPLMQWHHEDGKNLSSHYVWTSPPPVEKHNLDANTWNEVRCLIPFPWLWDGAPMTTTFPLVDPDSEEGQKYKYYAKKEGFRYLFVLEKNHETCLHHLALFPEFLKSEFHPVRSTIEAYSNSEMKQDVADGMDRGGFVAGMGVNRSTSDQKLKLRVQHFNGEVSMYNVSLFE